MKSSTLSSSTRSYTSKYEIKESIVCPIKQRVNKVNLRTNKNKDLLDSQDKVVFRGKIQCIPLIIKHQQSLKINQKGLNFLQSTGDNIKKKFIACIGNLNLAKSFIQQYFQSSKTVISNIQTNFQKFEQQNINIIVNIYNYGVKDNDQMIHFINIVSQEFQKTEEIMSQNLEIIGSLSNYMVLFITEKQLQSSFLDKLSNTLQKSINNRPKSCFLIYQQQIRINQQTLYKFEESFQNLILTSLKNNYKQKVKEISTSINQIEQKSNYFYGFFMKEILEHVLLKDQKKEEQLFKQYYNKKLAKIKKDIQQYAANLQLSKISTKQQLFNNLQSFLKNGILDFDSQIIDIDLHDEYLEKVIQLSDSMQEKIRQDYKLYQQQKQNNWLIESQLDDQQKQIDNAQHLFREIDILILRNKEHNQTDSKICEKIMILARQAARLHILGYDQKIKIAQLRQRIDNKWKQIDFVYQQKAKKLQEPTQHNLLREKYKMMQEKIQNDKEKLIYLQRELMSCKKDVQDFPNLYPIRLQEHQQILRLKQKNETILKYIQQSTFQNPLINTIKGHISVFEQKNKHNLLKKQLIIQSLKDIQQESTDMN